MSKNINLKPIFHFISGEVKQEAREYGTHMAKRAFRQAGVVVFFGGMMAFAYNQVRKYSQGKNSGKNSEKNSGKNSGETRGKNGL